MTPQQAEVFKDLTDVLEDEIKIYRSLLDLVRREKEILIAAKIDDLNSNNKAKEAFIFKIKGLEKIRERHAREMANLVGADSENPRLLEIAAKIDSAESSRLHSIHTTLNLLIKRIKEINTSNETLVQSSIKMVNGALGAIREQLQPKPTYGSGGDIKEKKSVAGAFVSKDV